MNRENVRGVADFGERPASAGWWDHRRPMNPASRNGNMMSAGMPKIMNNRNAVWRSSFMEHSWRLLHTLWIGHGLGQGHGHERVFTTEAQRAQRKAEKT